MWSRLLAVTGRQPILRSLIGYHGLRKRKHRLVSQESSFREKSNVEVIFTRDSRDSPAIPCEAQCCMPIR